MTSCLSWTQARAPALSRPYAALPARQGSQVAALRVTTAPILAPFWRSSASKPSASDFVSATLVWLTMGHFISY